MAARQHGNRYGATRGRLGAQVLALAGAVAMLLLAGCAPTAQDAVERTESPGTSAPPEPAFTIEEFDFGNTEWSFVPYTESYPSVVLDVVDGSAEVEGMQYTVVTDKIVYSDADGDGDLDALVPIEAYGGGNSVDAQWYIWADRDGEAVQVGLPVARSIHCGTVTERVAAASGGFEIHEFRRNIGEDHLACVDRGSDERIRTVGISKEGPDGSLWPVQTAPFRAFGGICPVTVEYHAHPLTVDAYAAPSEASEPLDAGERGEIMEWQVAEWPVYANLAPGYLLIGVNVDAQQGCAWARR